MNNQEQAELITYRDELLARLEKGWVLVRPGGEREHDDRYHDHFEKLLQQYETVCDQIDALPSMAASDSGHGSPWGQNRLY